MNNAPKVSVEKSAPLALRLVIGLAVAALLLIVIDQSIHIAYDLGWHPPYNYNCRLAAPPKVAPGGHIDIKVKCS